MLRWLLFNKTMENKRTFKEFPGSCQSRIFLITKVETDKPLRRTMRNRSTIKICVTTINSSPTLDSTHRHHRKEMSILSQYLDKVSGYRKIPYTWLYCTPGYNGYYLQTGKYRSSQISTKKALISHFIADTNSEEPWSNF